MRSHPEWVRGLKHIFNFHPVNIQFVAPRVGAWIETDKGYKYEARRVSHPEWVRGLKLFNTKLVIFTIGRTPSGCVD